jgi:alanyl-tRNA synthetase
MNLSVNPSQRHAKMRAHTATHLLHALIHHYIPTTQQAGSLVDNDYVRFDYTSDDMLTPTQITEINTRINEIIWLARDVTTTEMNIDQALATGAKAFFQDKYGDVVRVVQVHWDDILTSVELCGGTHVSNTREIGAFVIVEQSPVASGTKRIVAYTWHKTLEYSSSLEANLQSIASKLDCSPKQIDERLGKTLKDFELLQSEVESLKSWLLQWILSSNLPTQAEYKLLKLTDHPQINSIKLADIVAVAKTWAESVIIISPDGGYAVVGWSDAKAFAQSQSLKGGGSEWLFQGKDEKILQLF